MTEKKMPSAGDAGRVGAPDGATERPQYTTNRLDTQALGAYWLARWSEAGGTPCDRDRARETWPDVPEDRADVTAWLAARPDLALAVEKANPTGPPPGGPPLNLLTAYDILTTDWPDPVWAIPGILPAGLTILAGKPKVGKSWLALQIAQSVVTGGFALGQHVERGPILYLALEDTPGRLKSRMAKQNWPLTLDADFMQLGQFADKVGDLRNGGGEVLARQIESKGYRLVVIDTLSRSVYGDQNDVEKMTMALEPIQEMALTLNTAVVLVDHHKKGFGADADAVGDILGSTAKGAMADCLLGLYRERGKSGAKLAVVGRDVEEHTLALTWDYTTGCWQLEGDADELALTERRQEILDALEGIGRASLKEVAEVIEQPKSNTHGRLQDLFAAGLVTRVEQGKRVYYELS